MGRGHPLAAVALTAVLHLLAAPVYLLRGLLQLRHRLAAQRLVRSGFLRCPYCRHGNRLDLLARCPRCGFTEYRSLALPCAACGWAAGWIDCAKCGASLRLP